MFSNADMVLEDYEAVSSLCKLLWLNVQYVDIDHFADSKTGTVLSSSWAVLRGKASVIWAPNSSAQTAKVPSADLLEHVKAGGGVVSGGKSVFTLTGKSFSYATAGRKSVQAGAAVQLSDLKNGLVINEKCVQGAAAVNFIVALLASLSTTRKLRYLFDDPSHGGRVVGTAMLSSYQTFVTAGCCGFGSDSKVAPVLQKPCTIRDLVLASIRADLMLDSAMFMSCGALDGNAANRQVLVFARAFVVDKSHSPKVNQMAADIYAVFEAAGFLDQTCHIKSPDVKFIANCCLSISSNGGADAKALAERIKDLDVLTGFSRRSKPVDLSSGICLHINAH